MWLILTSACVALAVVACGLAGAKLVAFIAFMALAFSLYPNAYVTFVGGMVLVACGAYIEHAWPSWSCHVAHSPLQGIAS
jgi:hypothetical protein